MFYIVKNCANTPCYQEEFSIKKTNCNITSKGQHSQVPDWSQALNFLNDSVFTGFKFHHSLPPAHALQTMEIVSNIRKKTNPDSITVPCFTFTCCILEDKMWMVLGPCHLVLWLSCHCCKPF